MDDQETNLTFEDKNKDRLIHFLDTEIESINSKRQQPGWTIWAVSGSLAAAFWLLLNEVEKGLFSSIALLGNLVVISLLMDFIFELKIMLGSHSRTAKGRFVVTNILAGARLTLLLSLIRYIVVFYFVYMLSVSVDKSVSGAGYIVSGWHLLNYLAIMVLSFLRIPLPLGRIKRVDWSTKIGPPILMLLTLYLIIGYSQVILSSGEIIASVRAAVLIASIYYLLTLASSLSVESPLLDSLVNIRRELSLGQLEYKQATEQADIAIAGLKMSNVLQEYLGNILRLFDELNAKIKQISIHVGALEKILIEAQGDVSDEQKAMISSLMLSVKTLSADAKEISQVKIPQAIKPFTWRLNIIKSFSDVSSDEIENVLNSISTAAANTQNQTEELTQRINSMFQRVETNVNYLDAPNPA